MVVFSMEIDKPETAGNVFVLGLNFSLVSREACQLYQS
jgi:hypothetical protein